MTRISTIRDGEPEGKASQTGTTLPTGGALVVMMPTPVALML